MARAAVDFSLKISMLSKMCVSSKKLISGFDKYQISSVNNRIIRCKSTTNDRRFCFF